MGKFFLCLTLGALCCVYSFLFHTSIVLLSVFQVFLIDFVLGSGIQQLPLNLASPRLRLRWEIGFVSPFVKVVAYF